MKTCLNCRKENGKIYSINESVYPTPPLHPNCRCVIERLKTLLAGTATNQGFDGADWQLRFYGKLPDYYITPEQATSRVWYEADINYEFGYRGTQRILFSNDGLIFVTYDHYDTFVEIG